MGERIIEELTEQELMSIVGGAEGKAINTGDKCPTCKTGTLVKDGNKYVCSRCYKAFTRKHCKNCGLDRYCMEVSGGREKCVVCKKDV